MAENKNVDGVDRYVPVGLVKKMLGLIQASIDDGDGFDRYEWLDFVEQMPSVDLVRCEDCKYWGKSVPGKFDVGGTSWEYCCIVERMTPWKWFCGSAERKERDGNE